MDARNVRVLRPYEEADENAIYVDNSTREYLGKLEWDSEVLVIGRRKHRAVIKPLKEIDSDAQIARMKRSLRDKLMIEWGEEALLQKL
ncbi:MAG: hypothetical protein RQM95_05660 [Syntrophaceticus schinkii]|jgi:regulator of sirC expression with transglutaminase-like and TPR domain